LQLRNEQHATLLVIALILPHDHHGLDIAKQPARGPAAWMSDSLRSASPTLRLRPRFACVGFSESGSLGTATFIGLPPASFRGQRRHAAHQPGAGHRRRRRMALDQWLGFLAKLDSEFSGGSDTNTGTAGIKYSW
jgi:hypothetical protein